MTQDPNLPDGCTQADIDRAMGAMPDELEREIDEAVAQLHAVRKILLEYQTEAVQYRQSLRKLSRLYDDVVRRILAITAKSSVFMESITGETVKFFDDLSIDDFKPDQPFQWALENLPSDDDLSEQIQWTWEENNGR